jgi:hypothetical protein
MHFRIDQGTGLNILAKHVEQQLKKREFCVVFENDLERCWPIIATPRAEREREIQGFAKSHGWTAEIIEGAFGTRAIFYPVQGFVGEEGTRARGSFWRSLKAPG